MTCICKKCEVGIAFCCALAYICKNTGSICPLCTMAAGAIFAICQPFLVIYVKYMTSDSGHTIHASDFIYGIYVCTHSHFSVMYIKYMYSTP